VERRRPDPGSPSPHDWWLEQVACTSYPIEGGDVVFSPELRIPIRPLIGCIATAPEIESVRSVAQGTYGGNMDCNEIGPGATVLLPVNVPGALRYFGDCKAIMEMAKSRSHPRSGHVSRPA
jgi:acetamidase/formamidase